MQIKTRSYNARMRMILIDDSRGAICQFFHRRAVVTTRRLSDCRGKFSRANECEVASGDDFHIRPRRLSRDEIY